MRVSGHLKKLVSDSAIYGVGNMLSKFINIFLVPVYTAIFTPGDYGIISIISNTFILITILLVLGLDNSTARWFYDKDSFAERKVVINTWFWFYILLSSIFCLVGLVGGGALSVLLFGNESNAYFFRIMSLVLPLTAMMRVTINVLRFDRRPVPTIFLTLLQNLLLIGLNIILVVYLKKGLVGIYYAQLISSIVACCLAVVYLRKWLMKPFIDFTMLREMIKYSLPFVPAAISFWVVNLSGTFFINYYKGSTEAGIFQIGASIASGGGLIITAFQQAWMPFAFSILKQENAKKTYAKVFMLYVTGMSFVCLGMSFFSKEILVVLTNKEYYQAANIAAILTYSYFLMGLTSIADLGTAITKQTKPLGFILIISALLYPVFNVLLVPWCGKEGAALATCFSQVIVPVYMFYRSQKAYIIPYDFSYGIVVFFSCVFISLLSWNVPVISESILLKSTIFVLFLFITARKVMRSNNIGLSFFTKKMSN